MTVMIQNLGRQREIFDGGLDEQGVRQTMQLDPQGIGLIPAWAETLPALHRAVEKGRVKVVAGALREPVAPRVETTAPAAAPAPTGTLADVIAALRALPAEQRALLAAELLQG